MPSQHALLSPSSAHRWLHCTASPLLERDVEDTGSAFAEEGTLAHAYCAKKLKDFLSLPHDEEDSEIEQLGEQYHTGEMDEYTDVYKAIVLEKFNVAREKTKDARLLVEVRLDFRKYIPDSFGTSDAVIIADGVMEVIDFKYGKGVEVSAVENPQMMIYALGAWEMFNFEYDIREVRMTIIQPRIGNISEFTMTATALLAWAEGELKAKAREAYKGGEQVAGDWCRFCKVKARCGKLADTCMTVVGDNPETALLSDKTIARQILPMLPVVKQWLASMDEYTLKKALDGTHFDGYKLVEGRSVRKITNQEAVMDALDEAGFAGEAYLKPTELRSLTDLEKVIGKKRFNDLCSQYIIKPQGKPTLVPESDKRPVFNASEEDFKDL